MRDQTVVLMEFFFSPVLKMYLYIIEIASELFIEKYFSSTY